MTQMMRILLILGLIGCAVPCRARDIPRTLPDHPGNIFLAGQAVDVALPAGAGAWSAVDYESHSVAHGAGDDRVAHLGKLPVGYYEIRRDDNPAPVTAGVLATLAAPPSDDSPISIDVAMAWIYKTAPRQKAAANLCTLLGVNWVRDRLDWTAMEPARGQFAGHNIYDDSARVQSDAGLKILQVSHISPPWAGTDPKHFPPDLRDVYQFYKSMSARWKGQVLAFEPWNEADITMFGGHTGCEMATLQKAAYLGLKAGNPNIIACENVFAIARQATLDDFGANDAGAYFDTYNLHHYVPFEKYPAYYAAHRGVSAGKPIWVTESNINVHWSDEKTHEPSDQSLRWQANRVAKIFAGSLHEGSVNTFYFILGNYVERDVQYGLLHDDLTPRPAFVAMAAVGRLLADARPMGRWKNDNPHVFGYLFHARPDGQDKAVLVAWCTGGEKTLALNLPVQQVFDHLGRERQGTWNGQLSLSAAPVFAVMPIGPAQSLKVTAPPTTRKSTGAAAALPVVLQVLMDPKTIALNQSACVLSPGEPHAIKLFAYNFGDSPAQAKLRSQAPQGWHLELPNSIELPPHSRQELKFSIALRPPQPGVHVLKLVGTSGSDDAVVSFRVLDVMPGTQK